VIGTQIGGALGASVDVLPGRWLGLGAEAFVLAGTSAQLVDATDPTAAVAPLVPAEWIAHASTAHFLQGDLTLAVGGGTTIPFTPHGALTSPRYRVDLAIRYAPAGTGAKTLR
jgi:OmpA-OmpF porin, OOP family